MKNPVQYFSKEYLKWSRTLKAAEILQFLEDFRILHGEAEQPSKTKSKLISIKVPEDLLRVFRVCAMKKNIPYQTQIKNLMKEWIKSNTSSPL